MPRRRPRLPSRAPAPPSRSSSFEASLVSNCASERRPGMPGRRFCYRSGTSGNTRHTPDVALYTSSRVWYPSRDLPVQTGQFLLDVWSPTGDAAKQGDPHTGVPLTSSAVSGYTDYLRCTLTSPVPFPPLWSICRGAFVVRAMIVPRQVRKDPCWQHRAAPPPRI